MSSVDYNMLISTLESTVVTEYIREDIPAYSYQSEAICSSIANPVCGRNHQYVQYFFTGFK